MLFFDIDIPRTFPAKIISANDCMRNRRYKRVPSRILCSQFAEPEDLCYELDVNLGNRTEIFLSPGARVVVIEPLEEYEEYLEKRFCAQPVIVLVKKAVGS